MIQLLFAGIVIILIALLIMLFSRSQSLQRFAILELLLIVIVTLTVFLGVTQVQEFAMEQYFAQKTHALGAVRDYVRDMETGSLEDSEFIWQGIGDDIEALLSQTLVVAEGEEYSYEALAICERTEQDTYSIKVFRQTESELLSQEESLNYIQTYADEAIRLGEVVCERTEHGTGVMIYAGSGVVSPKYVYLTEISLAPLENFVEQIQRKCILYGGGFVLIGTLLLGMIIALQARQLKRLTRQVVRAAEGKDDWSFLEKKSGMWLESNEIRSLKNSFRQIVSDMARSNYMQYRILQAYFRFAPKQIEKIFGKGSILEVDVNDKVHLTGTLAFVACPEHKGMGEQEYLNNRNLEYEEVGEKQREYGGIFLSGNSDLTSLQLLFREETRKALHFGIDMAMSRDKRQQEQFFVLLHRTAFVYGIAGNEEQAFLFLLSKEMKMLEKYVERFRSAGIRMAVTDSVYELIEKETTGRYIGYLESDGLTFKIYEILDAYPSVERQNRMNTKDKFEQALNLFYQEDYYLGRNLFTEVLKECPDDEVAKWYLFLCEKCLNTEYGKSISGALFSD